MAGGEVLELRMSMSPIIALGQELLMAPFPENKLLLQHWKIKIK